MTAILLMTGAMLIATFAHLNYKLYRARLRGSRHPWYAPSAWASALLYEVARHAPNEGGMLVAALYGVVEVMGLKRILRTGYKHRKAIVQLLRGRRAT